MGERILVIGLPRSGKTTFLAALWHVVSGKELNTKLTLQKLDGDYTHLNALRDAWLQRKEFERTKLGDQKTVSLDLVTANGSREFQLLFPDYSGEVYRRQWRDRLASRSLAEETADANAVMLFLHGDKFIRPMMLSEVNAALSGAVAAGGEPPTEEPVEWDPNKSATQVQLVELLQFIQRPPLGPRRRRVVIVISAWDKVLPKGITPENWMKSKMPMLHQFVLNNSENYEFALFGVSAQGGDYKDDAERLDTISVQSERVTVEGPSGTSSDITEPLFWALDLPTS